MESFALVTFYGPYPDSRIMKRNANRMSAFLDLYMVSGNREDFSIYRLDTKLPRFLIGRGTTFSLSGSTELLVNGIKLKLKEEIEIKSETPQGEKLEEEAELKLETPQCEELEEKVEIKSETPQDKKLEGRSEIILETPQGNTRWKQDSTFSSWEIKLLDDKGGVIAQGTAKDEDDVKLELLVNLDKIFPEDLPEDFSTGFSRAGWHSYTR